MNKFLRRQKLYSCVRSVVQVRPQMSRIFYESDTQGIRSIIFRVNVRCISKNFLFLGCRLPALGDTLPKLTIPLLLLGGGRGEGNRRLGVMTSVYTIHWWLNNFLRKQQI